LKNQQGRSMSSVNPNLSDPFSRPTVTVESRTLVDLSMRAADCDGSHFHFVQPQDPCCAINPLASSRPRRDSFAR
jgi:hypothetical protein